MSTMPAAPEPGTLTTSRAVREVLVDALIAEYGFDREHWAALGSANRIARTVEAHVARHLGETEPTT